MTPPRKRRTREHVIADLSLNFVERVVFRCGHTLTRMGGSDYGIDLLVWTYSPTGEVENGTFGIQLKATDRLTYLAGGQTISFRVDTADLVFWRGEPAPVHLVLYDAAGDRAYWIDIREFALSWQPGATAWRTKTVRVRIPTSNRLTMHAMRRFRRWKNRRAPSPPSNPTGP